MKTSSFMMLVRSGLACISLKRKYTYVVAIYNNNQWYYGQFESELADGIWN
jgi:hypothetical protein